jgi:hypothetical protein
MACQWTLSWIRYNSLHPHNRTLRSILTLSSYLQLHFPGGLFPSSFFNIILCLISHIHATHPVQHYLLHFITLIISAQQYKLWSSSSICYLFLKHLWEHPTVQTHNPYSFSQHENTPRSNTQSLLLQSNSPSLTPSARQSLLPIPCSNDAVFILYG